MSIPIEVWGDFACFTRPELSVERVSYDVMTPSAARGILDSVYWHPGLKWRIESIRVCAPIRFTNIKRNEVKEKANTKRVKAMMTRGGGEIFLAAAQNRTQRSTLLLRDVRYVIEAHLEVTKKAEAPDNPTKYAEIALRRFEKGQCYNQPYFGTREFPAFFKICEEIPPCPDELLGERDLGLMAYDFDYATAIPTSLFFHVIMKDGLIQVPPPDSEEILR